MRLLILLSLWLPSSLWAATWVASIEPLAMVARELLGERVQVQTLLLPNQTPHFAAFTPAQLQQVRDADQVLWLGAEAEPHLQALLARARGESLALLSLPGAVRQGGGEHDHGADEDHEDDPHLSLDPHAWLAVENLIVLADAVVARARETGLDDGQLAQRHERLVADLRAWHAAARQKFAPLAETPWLSQHDPWGYFTISLGIRPPLRISASVQGSASSRRFVELMAAVQAQTVTCVVREPEAQVALIERLCPQCRQVALDPLARDRRYTGVVSFLMVLSDGFARCLSGSD